MVKQIIVFTAVAVAVSALATPLEDELKYYFDRHSVQDEGYEMVANYAQKADVVGNEFPDRPIRLLNVGKWTGMTHEGTGIEQDSAGRITIGVYSRGTITRGIRTDSTSVYMGDFALGKASGHGKALTADGAYREGSWSEDKMNGFGFCAEEIGRLRVGQWKNDRYLGEHMRYTSERIYGIDISRYQHGKGRKKWPIHWNQLRITYLGSTHQKRAAGAVDYPVDFVFIKSTEGKSIRNPFYHQDYRQARKQGVAVGAYHFFSTKSSGTAQARHFIANTQFNHGDLPPVLDVEPYPSQIKAMGGVNVMFSNVRAWLHAVERHTGVKPILYVSQSFVNRYMDHAPDLKKSHQVWIARYGEYRPDVKLAMWQLSPYGRVCGIKGDVDINVFNGFRTQWEEFRKEMTIKH